MYACEKNEDDVLAIALVNAGANYNFPPIVSVFREEFLCECF